MWGEVIGLVRPMRLIDKSLRDIKCEASECASYIIIVTLGGRILLRVVKANYEKPTAISTGDRIIASPSTSATFRVAGRPRARGGRGG